MRRQQAWEKFGECNSNLLNCLVRDVLYSLLYAVGHVIDQDFTDLSAPLVQAVAWYQKTVMEGWSQSLFPGTRSELAAFSPANSPCSYIEEPPTSITIERTMIRHVHLSSMYDELYFIGCFMVLLLDFRLIRKIYV